MNFLDEQLSTYENEESTRKLNKRAIYYNKRTGDSQKREGIESMTELDLYIAEIC